MASTTQTNFGALRQQDNFTPLPYRGVSYQPYEGSLSAAALREHVIGREVYRRTDVIVLHNAAGEHAIVAVKRADEDALFAKPLDVEVLALPASCVFVHEPTADTANRSSLADLARREGIGAEQTLVVQGLFDHVNLIHRPKPLTVRVIEVIPPEPPKLFHMVQQVLSYADLPPICLELEQIDLKALAKSVQPEAYLVPCRCGGLDELGAPVHFLDERPPKREDWTLIGCERSLQFHRHYYGDEPPRVEMCPRKLKPASATPTLLKCCLLEFDIETEAAMAVVPWGADLAMIERALKSVASEVAYV